MIVTDRFVYVHMPKTGGTFVVEMLRNLHRSTGRRGRFEWLKKHGRCREIPEPFGDLPIVGCIRNPYDRYVSQFHYQWWRRLPGQFPGLQDHPSYPDLSFEEFVRLANERWNEKFFPERATHPSIGWQTAALIDFFALDPVALACSKRVPDLSQLREGLVEATFLKTESLNRDLFEFVTTHGYSTLEAAFLMVAPKVKPPAGDRSPEDNWRGHYSPELKRYVRERERLIFELVPEFDV